jgi:hypothetical protein
MIATVENNPEEKPNIYMDTVFVRFLAILLITNSHLDRLYPIPQLGTGGAIGNTLFFMMSGYGLYLSYQKRPLGFSAWYRRRVSRIYPSLIIAVGIIYLFVRRGWKHWGLHNYITNFLWPTPYWFITALMLNYIIIYLILKHGRPVYYLYCIAILVIPYSYFYGTSLDLSVYSIEGASYFKCIFYLQIMCWGGYWASREKQLITGTMREFWSLLLLIGFYYLFLFGVASGPLSKYQCITHLLLFPISYLFLTIARSDYVLKVIMEKKYVAQTIIFVGGLTLEIYLLQNVVYSNSLIESLYFPLNIIMFWIGVVFLSYLLQNIAIFLRNRSSWLDL